MTSPAAPHPTTGILPIFRDAVVQLKARTKVPIYLPTVLPGRFQAKYVDVIENVPYEYIVEIATAPACMSRPACANAEIQGYLYPNATTPLLSGKRVRLRDGTPAYWASNQCPYLGCSYNGLTFKIGSHIYVVAQIHGTLNDAVEVANSLQKIS